MIGFSNCNDKEHGSRMSEQKVDSGSCSVALHGSRAKKIKNRGQTIGFLFHSHGDGLPAEIFNALIKD